jgi:hypothetical protein
MLASQWYVIGMALATAAVFFALAASLMSRTVRHEGGRLANTAFALWWFSLGVQQSVAAVRIPVGLAEMPFSLLLGLHFVTVAAVTFGLAGLLTYLLYLFTGRAVVSWPIFLGYSAYGGWLVHYTIAREPLRYDVGPWGVTIDYARTAPPMESLLVLLVLLGPQLAAIAGLVAVAARLPPSASRWRMLVVAAGTAAWFLSALLATALAVTDPVWRAANPVLPLAVGTSVLLVYRPPAWLQRRLPPEIPSEPPPGQGGGDPGAGSVTL